MLSQNAGQACQQLKELAKHFAESDSEKALRFASEAIIRARSLDDPDRTLRLAELGVLVWLGNKEVGEKLVQEAAETASKWPANDQRQWQVISLAKTIAPIDLPRAAEIAREILQKQPRQLSGRHCDATGRPGEGGIAAQGCRLRQGGLARAKLAYRLAATRPADAIRIIEGTPTDYGREELTKAVAFGWIATVISPMDPKLRIR